MLIPLEQQRIAVLLESLIVLLAVAEPLLGFPTDRAGRARIVLADVTGEIGRAHV